MTSRPLLRGLAGGALVLIVLVVAAGIVVKTQSGVSLTADSRALAHASVGGFGGSVQSATATGPTGQPIHLAIDDGAITPTGHVAPGEQIRVAVTVKRPGATSWLLGKTKTQTLTVRTPAAAVSSRWVRVDSSGSVRVAFSAPINRVSYIVGHQVSQRTLKTALKSLSLGSHGATGSLTISAAARPWESLSKPARVTWFPNGSKPVAVVSPKPDGQRGAAEPIKLTFSDTVKNVLGSKRPTLSPATAGSWKKTDSHTLVFTPTGYGAGFGAKTTLTLPKTIGVAGPEGTGLRQSSTITWASAPGSTLRLQQLLAQEGYLPLSWSPSGSDVAKTKAAESKAATSAPKGSFSWKYSNTPKELRKLWTPNQVDAITRGAIMKFQDRHHLTVDAVAGPSVWKALLDDAIAGTKLTSGYSYVYVHRSVPQKLTLWHNGHTVLTSPGNTGIASAPTELGTFPVFEHLAVTTMSGTNPDGSHYNDPGIKWVSYFNGGDALHTFNRASFGTPQSLGCVELPESTAKRVWPYTPIGTLVTIED